MQWDRRVETYTFYAPADVAEVAAGVNVVFENWQKTSAQSFFRGRRVEMTFENNYVRQVQWSANSLAGAFAENLASYQERSRWVLADYHYTFSVTLDQIGEQTEVKTSTIEAIDEQHTAIRNHHAVQLPSAWSELRNLGASLERLL